MGGGEGSSKDGKQQAEARPRRWFQRDALRLPEDRERVRCTWEATPPLPDHWEASRSDAAVANVARLIMAEVAPPQKPAPRSQWLTGDAWEAVQQHVQVRRTFFSAVKARSAALLRFALFR